MGLFDNYSTPVAEIPTGFGLPVSSVPYAVVLTDVKPFTKKDGTESTILTFSVDTAVDSQGRKGKEDIWITHPKDGTDNAEVHAKNAKIWVATHLAIPASVYGAEGFELVQVKDKLIGNVRGHLLITAGDNPNFTNKKFTRAKGDGVTGASDKEVPESKAEETLDMNKLLVSEENGKW